jgi:hypothetical protein
MALMVYGMMDATWMPLATGTKKKSPNLWLGSCKLD